MELSRPPVGRVGWSDVLSLTAGPTCNSSTGRIDKGNRIVVARLTYLAWRDRKFFPLLLNSCSREWGGGVWQEVYS